MGKIGFLYIKRSVLASMQCAITIPIEIDTIQ